MKRAIAVLLVMSSLVVWRWRSHDAPQATVTDGDAKLALDRVWIDHIPLSERDKFNVFLLIGDESMGMYQNTSRWQGAYEAFRFEANGNEVRMTFPQTGTKEKVISTATPCHENRMDYCLVLDGGSHGVKKYYSKKGWEIDAGRGDTKEQIDAIERSAAELPTN